MIGRERRGDHDGEPVLDDLELFAEIEQRIAAGGDPLDVYFELVASGPVHRPRPRPAPGRRPATERLEVDAPEPIGFVSRAADGGTVGAGAARAIAAARSGGRLLDEDLRRLLAAALGYGLDDVRVHTGTLADAAAREVGARAFAVGRDLFFRDGAYDPGSPEGVRLIAHEVAHAAQAGRGELPAAAGLAVSTPGDATEHAADRFADDVVARRAPVLEPLASAPMLYRQPQGDSAISDDDKKKLLELNGEEMSRLLTDVEALDPDKRVLYFSHLDDVEGIDKKRMKTAFRAVGAKQAGQKARDFAFSDEDRYSGCRALPRDQRDAVFTYLEPGFKAPTKREPGSTLDFKDGRIGIIHRGYIKRQAGKNQLPWICNNPGAVGNGPAFKSPATYPGKTIGPAAINIYPTEEDGMTGLTAWIEFQGRVNDMTFGGFFQAHAPADDGKAGNKGNDPEAYFQRVAAQMGLDPKTSRGTKIKTMDARKIADGIRAVGEGYSLGGDVLIWPDNDKDVDRETWFSMMYWEDRA